VHGFVQEGRLRPIMVTSSTRLPAFPNVPTAEESGLPNFVTGAWVGLFGPRGLPTDLARHINAMLNIACRDEEARNRIAERGEEIGGGSMEEFARRVRAEHAEWGKIVREAGIRAE
jgi:tripartite-type tricarboxylate transporter receptor subunit TctC